jgi:5-methylcytosine-specific restriction endonuclease McrA
MEGKKCNKCGEWKEYKDFRKDKKRKDGHRSECKLCSNIYSKQYFQENKEQIYEKRKVQRQENIEQYREDTKQNSQKYREKNRSKILEQKKQYYQKNAKLIIEKAKQRYQKNTEKHREYLKQYYQENIEKMRKKNKQQYQENTEKHREYMKQYRQENAKEIKQHRQSEKGKEARYKAELKRRSNKNKVTFTSHERKQILDRDNWQCCNCGIKVHDRSTDDWNTPDKAHIDHVIPISKGGNSEPSNLQTLCRTCNLSKHAKVESQLSLF